MEAGRREPSAGALSPLRAQPRMSGVMREVNTRLRGIASTLDQSEPIAFFCECGLYGCYVTVWLTKLEFDGALLDTDGWILAVGHEPSNPDRSGEPPRRFRPSRSAPRARARMPRRRGAPETLEAPAWAPESEPEENVGSPNES
jgi:hypothetical protein